MTLSARDAEIVGLVDAFGQLKASQIVELCFATVSRKPFDRAMLRLTKTEYLQRIGRTPSDMYKGGAGSYIYQLGQQGWEYQKRPGRWKISAVNEHSLATADVLVNLTRAQDKGEMTIHYFTREVVVVEPDPDNQITGVVADLELQVSRLNGPPVTCLVEVDRGTMLSYQRSKVIQGKLAGYIRAWTSGRRDPFPRVIFLALNDWRAKLLRYQISLLPEQDRELFMVRLLDAFPHA